MTNHITTINQSSNKNTNDSFDISADDLLKTYLSTTNSHKVSCVCNSCGKDNVQLKVESNETNSEDYPELGNLSEKFNTFKTDRDNFNQSESPDMNILNKYLPYRNAISDNPEKLKEYDDLVSKILTKASFQISDEEFDKDTSLANLEHLKPMDRFLSKLIAGSIVDIYHNREDLIDSVLDRPGGFSLITLSRKQDSGAVGLYSTNSNFMLIDGASEIMGLLNLNDKNNNIEQLNIVGHEFTHAVDAVDSITSSDSSSNLTTISSSNSDSTTISDSSSTSSNVDVVKNDGISPIGKAVEKPVEESIERTVSSNTHTADGFLPGMDDSDKEIIKDALNEIKTNDANVEKYAQTDVQEFIATTLGETFIDNPGALKNGSPTLQALYDMYTNYLKYDPLNPEKAFV